MRAAPEGTPSTAWRIPTTGNAHCPQRNKDPAAGVAATANTRPTGCPGRLARMTAAAAGQRGGQTGSCPSLSPTCCVAVTWPRAAGALQCFPRSLRRGRRFKKGLAAAPNRGRRVADPLRGVGRFEPGGGSGPSQGFHRGASGMPSGAEQFPQPKFRRPRRQIGGARR